MAEIHWLVYIIIGFFLVLGSWAIDQERLLFFYYVGFIFLLVGIVKFIYTKSKSSEEGQKSRHSKPANMGQRSYNQPVHAAHSKSPNVKYCQACRTASYYFANYCHKCGARLS
ncbi:hypothetical protein HYU10_05425 [Candidatus Woesearchaeota archaeon]|nr:hypothetical protein [Candidatus Woesearchaeota archaeon]MBI2131176.1 hypothetical protein [Candidatus Woesearchaeota archaeon]MBI2660729.1 hypothetical protein [Candidatus Woesearchaeota archaeon]